MPGTPVVVAAVVVAWAGCTKASLLDEVRRGPRDGSPFACGSDTRILILVKGGELVIRDGRLAYRDCSPRRDARRCARQCGGRRCSRVGHIDAAT